MPKCSIIIPIFNASRFINETIESVLAQTFPDFELICIDDCSNDKTPEILKRIAAKDSRIKLLCTYENSGSARIPIDLGISYATGDFVSIIGHDDKIESKYLEKMFKREEETSADIVMGKMLFFDTKGGKEEHFSIPAENFDFNQIMTGRSALMLTIGKWEIGTNGALIRKILIEKQRRDSQIDPHLMNADEYDTRELLMNANIVAFCSAKYLYRQHDASITKQFSRKFECVETDRYLASLFMKKYGKHSLEYTIMNGIYIKSLAHHGKEFLRKKELFASNKEEEKVSNILKRNLDSFTIRQILDLSVKGHYKFRLLYLKLILKSI